MLARSASRAVGVGAAFAASLLAFSPTHAETDQQIDVTGGIILEEVRAELPWSGRVNTVAVNPADRNNVLAATESGGLFASVDGGISWAHVDAISTMRLVDVAFWPADTNVVVATAQADRQNLEINGADRRIVTSRGGIWISRDRGLTWDQPTAAIPAAANGPDVTCPERQSAYGIAVDPRSALIAVATDCGVSLTEDGGETWQHLKVSTWPATWTSVAILSDQRLIVSGRQGVRWSEDGGKTWHASDAPSGTHSPHALDATPNEPLGAFAAINSGVMRSKDGGKTWTTFSAPDGSGAHCGGQPLIKATGTVTVSEESRQRGLEIFYGDGCSLFRLSAAAVNNGGPIEGRWSRVAAKLNGARAVGFESRAVFDDAEPGFHRGSRLRFVAFHSGLEKFDLDGDAISSAGPVGSGPTGLTALQISDVGGQRVRSASEYQLVLGSQGTNLISSVDGFARYATTGGQGFGLDLPRVVQGRGEAMMTYRICDPCRNQAAATMFSGARPWVDPPGADFWPRTLKDGRAVQLRNAPAAAHEPRKIYLRERNGQWRAVAEFPEAIAGDVGISGPAEDPVLYVPVRGDAAAGDLVGVSSTFNVWHLARVSGINGETANRAYPAMRYTAGAAARDQRLSLGFMPVSNTWIAVYAVDPADPMHLMAPDVLAGVMAESWDGGETWQARQDLTALITRGTTTPFVTRGSQEGASVYFPIVSFVSFHPDEPSLVLIGTWQAGLFFSRDRGASWMRIPDSERATMVTDVHWKSLNEAYVATYGRGLWRLRIEPVLPIDKLAALCKDCRAYKFPPETGGELVPAQVLDIEPNAEEDAVLVIDGHLIYAQIKGGGLVQALVTPGSSVVELLNEKTSSERAVSGITDETMAIAFGNSAEGEQIPRYAPREFAVAETRTPPDNLLPRSITMPAAAKLMNRGPGEVEAEAFYHAFEKAKPLGTVVGLTRKNGIIDGFVIAPAELTMPTGVSASKPVSTEPAGAPRPNTPSVWLASESPGLAWPVVASGSGSIWVHGRNFRPKIENAITVTIDRALIAATATADDKGNFSVKVDLPRLEEGTHEIAVTERFNGLDKLADATLLLVRSAVSP
jgi:photosystem II stability/assembly factor-like uncharacterized protein